mmetsp:Transcript_31334/g.76804  ORF Transcript_31334/g.76804 Transcript_31334/m.76804 type:complete len:84 (-) Transcript_31334:400-651(-)
MPPFGSPPLPPHPMGTPGMPYPHSGMPMLPHGGSPMMSPPPMPMVPPMMGMPFNVLDQGGNIPRDPAFAMGIPMQSAPMFKPF